jgi:hypothetical protein
MQANKSVLFSRNQTWCKKGSDSLFDVTMGSFDGAETCELVGLFLLYPNFLQNIEMILVSTEMMALQRLTNNREQ